MNQRRRRKSTSIKSWDQDSFDSNDCEVFVVAQRDARTRLCMVATSASVRRVPTTWNVRVVVVPSAAQTFRWSCVCSDLSYDVLWSVTIWLEWCCQFLCYTCFFLCFVLRANIKSGQFYHRIHLEQIPTCTYVCSYVSLNPGFPVPRFQSPLEYQLWPACI